MEVPQSERSLLIDVGLGVIDCELLRRSLRMLLQHVRSSKCTDHLILPQRVERVSTAQERAREEDRCNAWE